jgi:hypothetical protein
MLTYCDDESERVVGREVFDQIECCLVDLKQATRKWDTGGSTHTRMSDQRNWLRLNDMALYRPF